MEPKLENKSTLGIYWISTMVDEKNSNIKLIQLGKFLFLLGLPNKESFARE